MNMPACAVTHPKRKDRQTKAIEVSEEFDIGVIRPGRNGLAAVLSVARRDKILTNRTFD